MQAVLLLSVELVRREKSLIVRREEKELGVGGGSQGLSSRRQKSALELSAGGAEDGAEVE